MNPFIVNSIFADKVLTVTFTVRPDYNGIHINDFRDDNNNLATFYVYDKDQSGWSKLEGGFFVEFSNSDTSIKFIVNLHGINKYKPDLVKMTWGDLSGCAAMWFCWEGERDYYFFDSTEYERNIFDSILLSCPNDNCSVPDSLVSNMLLISAIRVAVDSRSEGDILKAYCKLANKKNLRSVGIGKNCNCNK